RFLFRAAGPALGPSNRVLSAGTLRPGRLPNGPDLALNPDAHSTARPDPESPGSESLVIVGWLAARWKIRSKIPEGGWPGEGTAAILPGASNPDYRVGAGVV